MTGVVRDRGEIDAVLDEGDVVDIVELAKKHAGDMVGVLVQAARSEDDAGKKLTGKKKVPWNVRAKCAKDVVEIAEGRPATKDVARMDTGLTIIVQNLFGNPDTVEKIIPHSELRGSGDEPAGGSRETTTLEVADMEIVSEPLIAKGGSPCQQEWATEKATRNPEVADSAECQEPEVTPSTAPPPDSNDPSPEPTS